jgi:hypothetical protein
MDRDIRLYRKELAFNRTEILETIYDKDREEQEQISELQKTLQRKMLIRKIFKKLKNIIITK